MRVLILNGSPRPNGNTKQMMKRLCFFLLCAVLVITASCGVAETSDITPQDADNRQTGIEMGANQGTAQVGVFDFENRTVSQIKFFA